MTVSFQLQTAEELRLLSSMLVQLKQSGINIQIISPDQASHSEKKIPVGVADRLHGIVKLPADFDYKSFMANEFLTKHG